MKEFDTLSLAEQLDYFREYAYTLIGVEFKSYQQEGGRLEEFLYYGESVATVVVNDGLSHAAVLPFFSQMLEDHRKTVEQAYLTDLSICRWSITSKEDRVLTNGETIRFCTLEEGEADYVMIRADYESVPNLVPFGYVNALKFVPIETGWVTKLRHYIPIDIMPYACAISKSR